MEEATIFELDKTDEEHPHTLERILRADGSTEYRITSSKDPSFLIKDDSLEKVMDHWKRIWTKVHSSWRNTHFDGIIDKVKKMSVAENDKQERMTFDAESTSSDSEAAA